MKTLSQAIQEQGIDEKEAIRRLMTNLNRSRKSRLTHRLFPNVQRLLDTVNARPQLHLTELYVHEYCELNHLTN